MEIALHDIFFVVPIVCARPTAWGIGILHQSAAVEEKLCPSAVGSKFSAAIKLVEEGSFNRFGRLVTIEASMVNRELPCHCVVGFMYATRKRGGEGNAAHGAKREQGTGEDMALEKG